MSPVYIFSYLAIYIIVWMVCLFAVLPWGAHSQADAGEVVHGTEPGAPARFAIWKKLLVTTVLAAFVVALIGWGISNPLLQHYWHSGGSA
jgi:predicted secreted protein